MHYYPAVSHAEHFLSRLERLSTTEVDLALQLYRDPALLRSILASVQVPEQIARVAISLADPALGPFLVITRDGHFVTCLGHGMRPTGLYVITRGQLDALSEKFATLRERVALASRLTGGHERPCAKLLRRVLVAADSVCREEWLAVSAWEPLLRQVFMDLYLAMGQDLIERGPLLRRLGERKFKPSDEVLLHDYWNEVHAASHLLLLGTMGGDPEPFETRMRVIGPEALSALSIAMTLTAASCFILKGAWAVGRLGKALLPAYKRALTSDGGLFEMLDSMFGLLAIARRATGLRAEVAKALAAVPRSTTTADAVRLRRSGPAMIAGYSDLFVAGTELDGEACADDLLRCGAARLSAVEGAAGSAAPSVEELPADVRRALALSHYADGLTDPEGVTRMVPLIVGSARGEPEQFYLPQEAVQAWHRSWRPELTVQLLRPLRRAEEVRRKPAVRQQRPGPNERCSCGSGSKYKKCCGRAGGSAAG